MKTGETAIYICGTDANKDLLCRANLPSLHNRKLQENIILMYKVRNGLAPRYIELGELFNFANKGYSLINGDFDMPRYSTIRYGNHFDQQQPSLDNFRRNIRKKDLTPFIEGTCTNCSLCICKPRLQWNFITF